MLIRVLRERGEPHSNASISDAFFLPLLDVPPKPFSDPLTTRISHGFLPFLDDYKIHLPVELAEKPKAAFIISYGIRWRKERKQKSQRLSERVNDTGDDKTICVAVDLRISQVISWHTELHMERIYKSHMQQSAN